MLVRNLHLSYLSDCRRFCALLDFVDPQWRGGSKCSFGDVLSGARRVAEYEPYAICFLSFKGGRSGSALTARYSSRESVVHLDRIDADSMFDLATAGEDVLCCKTTVDPPANEIFSYARRVLARIWRAQSTPGAVLDERNAISRACYVLMNRYGCSESDAFTALRARAMDRQMPLAKLAGLVLDT